jgi:hypothetical protein
MYDGMKEHSQIEKSTRCSFGGLLHAAFYQLALLVYTFILSSNTP